MIVINFNPLEAFIRFGAGKVGPGQTIPKPSITLTGHLAPEDRAFWLETGENLLSLRDCALSLHPMSSNVRTHIGNDQIGVVDYFPNPTDKDLDGSVHFTSILQDEKFWDIVSWIKVSHLPRVFCISLVPTEWLGEEPKWNNIADKPLAISGISYEFVVGRSGD